MCCTKYIMWLLMCVASPVLAHGGGLNAEGCHNNRKTGDYHCHRGGESSASKHTGSSPASAKNSGGPTCYTGPRGGTYTITKSGQKNYKGC
jgi:hypothetical protein